MPWKRIGEERCYPRRALSYVVHVIWKCLGCGFRAVNGGNDPGKCLNRRCPYYVD